METIQPEICHSPTVLDQDALFELNLRVREKEQELNIHTEKHRWAEATLFVDNTFIAIEALNGRSTGFERLLGHVEWEGYLDAKAYCEDYGLKPVTPAFFLGIHREFLARQAPHVAGTYATGTYRGIRKGSNGETLPLSFNEKQIAEIKNNPFLDFQGVGADPTLGFLQYQYRTPKEHQKAIAEVCEWHNDMRNSVHDPVALGALLERKLIERHAFAFGICGRVARMAMNWSLTTSGLPASSLSDFNKDILVSESEWITEVEKGCQRQEDLQTLALYTRKAIDPIDFFGLKSHAAARQSIPEVPPKLEPGYQHHSGSCEAFMEELRGAPNFSPAAPQYAFDIDRIIQMGPAGA